MRLKKWGSGAHRSKYRYFRELAFYGIRLTTRERMPIIYHDTFGDILRFVPAHHSLTPNTEGDADWDSRGVRDCIRSIANVLTRAATLSNTGSLGVGALNVPSKALSNPHARRIFFCSDQATSRVLLSVIDDRQKRSSPGRFISSDDSRSVYNCRVVERNRIEFSLVSHYTRQLIVCRPMPFASDSARAQSSFRVAGVVQRVGDLRARITI